MATIVEYTDQKAPQNFYPERIVSPPHSGPCCFSDMEEIGMSQDEGRWVYQYKRCRKCGFTVRVILREIPDAALVSDLRQILATAFQRNVPELKGAAGSSRDPAADERQGRTRAVAETDPSRPT